MKVINLTQGQQAIVDDCDYESLSQFKWYAARLGNSFYAVRSEPHPIFGRLKRRSVLMHRVIMGVDGRKEPFVDHIDHNGLNNTRKNLRLVTNRENSQNRHIRGTSQFIGVSFEKSTKKWQANIWEGQKQRRIGLFDNEVDAARAYDTALVEIGAIPVNFPDVINTQTF